MSEWAGTVVTGVLAFAAFWQIRISTRSSAAALASAEAARRASEQAAKARIDDRAPIVVALPPIAEWPPLLHMSRERVPGGGEPLLLDAINIHGSQLPDHTSVFAFPRDQNKLLWFKIWGLIRNEGRTTAVVRLKSHTRFVDEAGPFSASVEEPVVIPQEVGGEGTQAYALPPGASAVFNWADGHPLHEWADAVERPEPPNPHGALFFSMGVEDGFEDGVIDGLFAVVTARPIERIADQTDHWRLAQQRTVGGTRYPTRRHYRGLDPWPPTEPPPWVKDFPGGS